MTSQYLNESEAQCLKLWVVGYLGLLHDLSRYMTPPPQVREQSDHSDHPDHWPCTALGPWSPNLTHCPLRHHCIMGKKKKGHLLPLPNLFHPQIKKEKKLTCQKPATFFSLFFYIMTLYLAITTLQFLNVILYVMILRLWLSLVLYYLQVQLYIS